MKKIWIKIVEAIFPGSYKEYLESKEIHKKESKKYRKNPQFIVGVIFFGIPLIYLIFFSDGWMWKIIAVLVACGEMLIRDTISEHYCAIINRERKSPSNKSLEMDA